MKKRLLLISTMFFGVAMLLGTAVHAAKKPNILVIWGDDIGQSNIQRLHEGAGGLPDAQHRQNRQ